MNQVIDVWADLSGDGWLDLAVLLGFVLYFGGVMIWTSWVSFGDQKKARARRRRKALRRYNKKRRKQKGGKTKRIRK